MEKQTSSKCRLSQPASNPAKMSATNRVGGVPSHIGKPPSHTSHRSLDISVYWMEWPESGCSLANSIQCRLGGRI
jgi:hypothetical protein